MRRLQSCVVFHLLPLLRAQCVIGRLRLLDGRPAVRRYLSDRINKRLGSFGRFALKPRIRLARGKQHIVVFDLRLLLLGQGRKRSLRFFNGRRALQRHVPDLPDLRLHALCLRTFAGAEHKCQHQRQCCRQNSPHMSLSFL